MKGTFTLSKLVFILTIFLTSISIAENSTPENLLNTKWKLREYIIDGQSFKIEKKRKKDYYIFKENNQKEEVLYGKKVKGTWEFLPHGNFIMLYSEKKDVYLPARITNLSIDTLMITIFDIKTMKMLTLVYKSN